MLSRGGRDSNLLLSSLDSLLGRILEVASGGGGLGFELLNLGLQLADERLEVVELGGGGRHDEVR